MFADLELLGCDLEQVVKERVPRQDSPGVHADQLEY